MSQQRSDLLNINTAVIYDPVTLGIPYYCYEIRSENDLSTPLRMVIYDRLILHNLTIGTFKLSTQLRAISVYTVYIFTLIKMYRVSK